MLTRLQVSGFKNLVDVDVRFGPFTCIAGANGVGKSNLFDAIRFLSALADRTLVDAALAVRAEGGRSGDLRHIFHRVGEQYDAEMSFTAEMIVPAEGWDDLGQQAEAAITFLRYHLMLAYREEEPPRLRGGLELVKEELTHITLGEAKTHLLFEHQPAWRRSAVKGRRFAPFITTEGEAENRVIKLHQDGGPGRALSLAAPQLPRTVLSTVNAAENPTALLARREMQSWRLLLLEPSSLRRPDEFDAPNKLGTDGAHLPATLYHLARVNHHLQNGKPKAEADSARIYSQVANRLAELLDDVQEISIDRDEKRELLTLQVTGRDGTPHPARALSDGTLRFLALAVLELDPEAQGLLCLEEPENGIHPLRIPAMLQLLRDMAVDVHEPIGPDNPLRQVVINTHAPTVLLQVLDESVLVAELQEKLRGGQRFNAARFGCLPGTWRQKDDRVALVARGKLLSYLNPIPAAEPEFEPDSPLAVSPKARRVKAPRVIDRPDLQQLLFPK